MANVRWQRGLKVVHVASAGIWLGGLAALFLLQLDKPAEAPAGAHLAVDLASSRIHDVLVGGAFVVTLLTGLAFSLFTHWGFVRQRWITSKWILAIGLFALTLGWQSPSLAGLVALSDIGVRSLGEGFEYVSFQRETLRLAAAQLAIVVAIFFISTFKPWGRWIRVWNVHRKALIGFVSVGLILAVAMGILNFLNLRRFRSMKVPAADLAQVGDGSHLGGFVCDQRYEVLVSVRGGEILAAEAVQNRTSAYARFAEGVLPRIVARQSPDVDAITGATTTSKCLMMAAANALAGGGGQEAR